MKKIIVVYSTGLGFNIHYAAVVDEDDINDENIDELLGLSDVQEYEIKNYQELVKEIEIIEKPRLVRKLDELL